MAKEIERKFLIDTEKWGWSGTPVEMVQGYLAVLPEKVIRIRIAGDQAFLTIKGKSIGITRDEFEYQIPFDDANEILKMCGDLRIEKTRYNLKINEKKWEIDIFHGKNNGLIVAEIELISENEIIEFPEWIISEVTEDERYYNFNLAIKPFASWQ